MNLELYPFFVSDDYKRYFFYSHGPMGRIQKRVDYTKINLDPVMYNLAFGDCDPVTGELSDKVRSNNKDWLIVLATVVNTITQFCDFFGNHLILVTGSSPSRNRLYQINIAKYLQDISPNYEVYGFVGSNTVPFEENVNYNGFLVKRK